MQYRTMKKTGDSLSALGFGCMRLPKKDGAVDEERAMRQIRYAIDRGVNYLDTSWMYGNEAFIGRALADGYRERVKIATKAPLYLIRKKGDLDKLLNEQLHNLQTDHVDYYHFHALTPAAWDRLKGLGVTDFFAQAKADGRIRHIGFSSHNSTVDFKQVVDAYDWDFCLIQFNLLDETNQAGIEGLQYAAAKGLGIVIMEPLRGGTLAKTPPDAVRAIWNEADVKRTPAEWALRWVWDHPGVTVVLSGMNEEAHIEENLRVADEALPGSLTEKELALVGRVRDAYRRQIKVGCTGCHYCLPCPSGVNIPACFEYYNNMGVGSPMEERMKYVMFVGGGPDGSGPKGYASQCKGCRKCVSVCTQHIDIPAELKNVAREMEGLDTRVLGLVFRPALRTFTRYDRWRNHRRVRG